MTSPESLREQLEALRRAHPVTTRLVLHLAGVCVTVDSNRKELIASLERYFRSFVDAPSAGPGIALTVIEAERPDFGLALRDWPRDPGKEGRKDSYADDDGLRLVYKVRTGMSFVFGDGDGDRLAVGPCGQNLNQVVNFINASCMSAWLSRGYALCHAAGVAIGHRGLGLAGVSGAGKSTLSLRLVGRGASFVSNDRLLVKARDGRVYMQGVPKMPRVNPGTLLADPRLVQLLSRARRQELAALPRDQLWTLEDKHDVNVAAVYGRDRVRLSAPLSGFVLLTWSHRDHGGMRTRRGFLRERPDLIGVVAKHPGPFHLAEGLPHGSQHLPPVEDYLKHLADVPYLECSGGVDFEAAATLCEELLRADGGP